MLRAMERKSPAKDGDGSAKKSIKSDTDISKLTEKAKSLKLQYKDDKRKSMQASKNLEACSMEIEALQRELAQALDTIDSLEKDQASDRNQLLKLTNELEQWRKNGGKTPAVKRLESKLRQRNDELEETLGLLESKVQRIVQLENELHVVKRKLQDYHQLSQHGSFEERQGSLSSMDLQESQAECRRLRRQNMMLKLLFEELEERRTNDKRDALDLMFQKVATELDGSLSAKNEGVNISSDTDQGQCPTPENCSPVRECPSPIDDPSTDASSARAEALLQKEIERFNLEESTSSINRMHKSPQSPRNYLSEEWIYPYDL